MGRRRAGWMRRATDSDAHDTAEDEARPPTQRRSDNEALRSAGLYDAELRNVVLKEAGRAAAMSTV